MNNLYWFWQKKIQKCITIALSLFETLEYSRSDLLSMHCIVWFKEVQIVYRLFLVNCYLLQIPRLPSQPASTEKDLRGWVIEKNWLELAWQYIAVTRNNLYIIWIALVWLTKRASNFAMIACKMQTWQPNCILVRKCSYAWWNSRNSHKTILGMWERQKLYKLNSWKPLKMKVTLSSVTAVVEFSGQGSKIC